MVPTGTAQAPSDGTAVDAEPAKRKPPTPKRLQKKVLTLAEAADQFERTAKALVKLGKVAKTLEAERDEADEILQAYFDRTDRTDYKRRIGWMWTPSKLILDQGKVTTFLGEQLSKFQKRTESKRKLTLLAPPD
jgi:hypothetical protein